MDFQSLLFNRRPEVNIHSEAHNLANWWEAAYQQSSIMEGQTSFPLDSTLWLQFIAVPPKPQFRDVLVLLTKHCFWLGSSQWISVAKVSHSQKSLGLPCFPASGEQLSGTVMGWPFRDSEGWLEHLIVLEHCPLGRDICSKLLLHIAVFPIPSFYGPKNQR